MGECVPTDEELMRGLQNGDERALAILYERHSDKVWTYIRKRVPEDRVEDLFQDAFVKVVEKKQNWDGQPFVLWLYVIMRNLVIDLYRAEKIEKNAFLKLTNFSDDSIGAPFEEIVAQLPPSVSKLLREYFQEGLSYRELADHYRISEVSVRKRLSRAIKSLKKGESHER